MLEPMPIHKASQYNNNNFHTKAPFKFEEDILILDSKFYKKIKNTWVEKQLNESFKHIEIKENIIYEKDPESKDVSIEENKKFFKIYNIFLRWYDADKWYTVINDRPIELVPYSKTEEILMRKISNVMVITGKSNINESEKEDLKILLQTLDSAVDKCNQGEGCFVKLSGASTKHNYKPEPVFNGNEVLIHLLGSKRILNNLDCGSILIQAWNPEVKLNSEFRVFIEDNKVIGIGQQKIYEIFQECMSVYCLIYTDIIKMAQKLWNDISSNLEFSDATLDVWIDYYNQLHLIEINTYGIWTAAGSSWFDWESDFPVAENIKTLDDVPFRLTYPNEYFNTKLEDK
jgi:hypothetical protein